MKEHFKKETYMCVVKEQDSQFFRTHWVMVYQNKKNTYFIDSLEGDFTHYDFKFKRPVYQVSRRLQIHFTEKRSLSDLCRRISLNDWLTMIYADQRVKSCCAEFIIHKKIL